MNNNQQVATMDQSEIIERVIATGDLAKLTPQERTNYYMRVCASLGLNALTRPFEYISLNGKLTLYARKDATDQLRSLKGISVVGKPDIAYQDEWIVVTVCVRDSNGREDSDVGVVNRKDMRGDFGNAVMKAVTKAKRRATLSICGLGILDETEVETIPNAVVVPAELPVDNGPQPATGQPPLVVVAPRIVDADGWRQFVREHGFSRDDIEAALGTVSVMPWTKEHGKTLDDAAQKMIDWAAKPQTAAAGR